jgi:hypothetical protein
VRVIVTGWRHLDDYSHVCRALDALHAWRPITTLVHGAAPGADSLADRWARERGIHVERFPAEWVRLGHAAGPMRNEAMAAAGADLCAAFFGQRGTMDMIARAHKHGIPVRQAVGNAWVLVPPPR